MNCNYDHIRTRGGRPKNPAGTRVIDWLHDLAPLHLTVAALVAVVLAPASISAQQDASDDQSPRETAPDAGRNDASSRGSDQTDVVLWLFHKTSDDGASNAPFEEALRRALADADRRHLVSQSDFETYLADRSTPVPRCLNGLENCVSPRALVFRQLDLDAVVRLRLKTDDETLRADYRLIDRRGQTTKKASVTADTPDELAFALVRQLFDATGTVAIQSTPSDAPVRIDGKPVGTTPIEVRLPVGDHSFQIRHQKRQTAEGQFEISSGSSVEISRDLDAMESLLVIDNAPNGAVVAIDGEKRGTAGTRIEVQPGTYDIRVTADGYEPFETTIEFPPGKTVRRSAPMSPDPSLLQDISTNAIARNRYVARLTFDQSIHPASFLDARGDVDGTTHEFQSFASSGGDRRDRYTFDPRGLRADVSYTWRHFGVVGMSLSYIGTSIDRPAVFETAPPNERDRRGTITAIRRLQLRPLQITYRRFFKNFAPAIELGTGISFQWLDVEGLFPADDRSALFHQTAAFWTIGVSAQYFFNANWFGVVRYSFQDYFGAGNGVEHLVSIGAGVAYPDIFGFAPEPPEEL